MAPKTAAAFPETGGATPERIGGAAFSLLLVRCALRKGMGPKGARIEGRRDSLYPLAGADYEALLTPIVDIWT